MISIQAALVTILAANAVSGFNLNASPGLFKPTTHRASKLFGIRCEDKYYQLEEMEDKESSTTEIFLKQDRTVIVGQTTGPKFLAASGSWEIAAGTNNFKMTLSKRFGTGQSKNDMGEFNFDVKRTYSGEVKLVGESVGITGEMQAQESSMAFGNEVEVGYFNMIDGTDERANMGASGEKTSFS
mmetsp:Transcript_39107/g.44595  ORF Transcript_39107/g.44595 Transcript_39107/m.44595 type:complete len:184 (+) Transcript_39107:79-630(+)|eukprot:CAMPEP_0194170594 /NCGR_PEP_ID=MMETSP0154-20130528/5235_1 /TAXON_ID=1049557 /ORGANISM="Thalassiothrix antarctica, Strain L6-D1" /LENGTH=183 /DNA_ID=CAMNT_0038882509 /DNA_START=55 /DNA_END=606 /DNA_ORIENTATION=-